MKDTPRKMVVYWLVGTLSKYKVDSTSHDDALSWTGINFLKKGDYAMHYSCIPVGHALGTGFLVS